MDACGILILMENGRPVKIVGDPDNPVNRGIICKKGMAQLEYLYHPERLKHPLKRDGERGKGKWQQITWDEALGTVSLELTRVRDKYGAQSVVFIRGSGKGYQDTWLRRFANVFGTPNFCSSNYVCFEPTRLASVITLGYLPMVDYEFPPSCLVIWASDAAASHNNQYEATIKALNKGTRLIVIDPRKTGLSQSADVHLRLRPGTDLALALAMINVIINENLYDKDFVAKWTVGFDRLSAHIQKYSPESVQGITWLNAEMIKQAARIYAIHKPSCIESGNGFEHNVNSVQTGRAIAILRAITGNLGVPGGESQWKRPPTVRRGAPELELSDRLPDNTKGKNVSARLNMMPLELHDTPPSLTKAILEEEPYPIRLAYVQGCNIHLTLPNTQRVHRALGKLDFVVVSEMFMTPTASMADIVLPSATHLEYDSILESRNPVVTQVQQKVAQVGECRSDYATLRELAGKLGLGEYWDEEEDILDSILKPAGMTFEELRKVGFIPGNKLYRDYEKNGFDTPSGKVELYSSQFEEWDLDPLPVYYELPETPLSDPELAKIYPLIFTTHKVLPYRHSGGRQITTLRGYHPDPICEINPETAQKLGIKDGDWVIIETKRGKIRQKATIADTVDPRVVVIDYGWWFPERGADELYGWAESNVNVLTDDAPPFNREIGSANLRGIVCRVYRAVKQ